MGSPWASIKQVLSVPRLPLACTLGEEVLSWAQDFLFIKVQLLAGFLTCADHHHQLQLGTRIQFCLLLPDEIFPHEGLLRAKQGFFSSLGSSHSLPPHSAIITPLTNIIQH